MVGATESMRSRVIVVPRPLEGFFYERLTRHFAQRSDVKVVVDRRSADRRSQGRNGESDPSADRRRSQRRQVAPVWTLNDMPDLVC